MDTRLEEYLWNEISFVNDEKWKTQYNRWPNEVIREMVERKWINSPKQAHRTLEKWLSKGIYDYGSRLDFGWKVKKDKVTET